MKKFVFISIPKTGTQSVHTMLGANLKQAVNIVHGGILDNHCRAEVMREKYSDFDQRYVFCFVRNPWGRLISWYEGHRKWCISLYMSMSFEEWVLSGCPHHWKLGEKDKAYSPLEQHPFIYDKNGQCLANKIGRFENYSTDLKDILEFLNIDIEIQHINKSPSKKVTHTFSERMNQSVLEQFEKDILLWSYEIPENLKGW